MWWSAANEYDFNQAKTVEDWDDILRTIARLDPYEHLRSIHNGTRMYEVATLYDFTKPWVTHQSIQHWDVTPTDEWLRTCLKPVVLDEICYEGNIGKRWGNITGEELVDRFWEGMARGRLRRPRRVAGRLPGAGLDRQRRRPVRGEPRQDRLPAPGHGGARRRRAAAVPGGGGRRPPSRWTCPTTAPPTRSS
ncbi:hypothetical protein GCM10020220_061720 [Nonomuraea rubra]